MTKEINLDKKKGEAFASPLFLCYHLMFLIVHLKDFLVPAIATIATLSLLLG